MSHTAAFRVLTLILILGDLESITVVNHHPDEEYFLEHEVLYEEAITEAKKLQLYPAGTDKKGPIPGCKPCTRSEMTYCKDGSVINDHCCCDVNSNEVFPFVKHTCRMGPEECEVQAGDCAEYARLRECCCHSYLASVWKYLANDAVSPTNTHFIKFLAILTVLRWLL
ncbi:uncharacterized protein LOC126926157 isoform X1 [Bombus affinis]|uniref:Uncharacterized protein LOC100645815 isoform X1 n=1 Tax=Bombus terrestris TaxID=30195 RepID=A0A9C6W2P0_BOMTE|nr:uncharacterized protein LOC100645815 isoform X1 [Bombus terrestris]XP_048269971.1 uncharacterized protein LOC100645815 isoform X1 [Bombus terrestris]XP_050598235.1 uncharacterized protein LOC126926157 isoform X1 [Bombus affinis]XP_050598236.1 uncharacterized protein LOC126926157 isoform X1 [Bombus affinis]